MTSNVITVIGTALAPGIGDPARVSQICQSSQRNVTRYFLRYGFCNILQCDVRVVLKLSLKYP